MASFHNREEVQNQAYNQTVHGNIVYHNNYVNSDKRQRREEGAGDGVYAEKALDDAILASLAFPQMFDRRSNVAIAHQKTCEWIFDLEAYQNWRSKSSGLLWIKGKPGAGKSTLMSHLYGVICREPVASRGILLEFFFSARGVELQRTPLGMLRSLLNQVFHHDPSIRNIVRKPYLEKRALFGRDESTWKWQVPELQTLLTEAVLASAEHQQLVLLIDALDEAGERAARETAHYFHIVNDRIAQSTAKVRICISCRHYPIPSNMKAIEIVVEQHNHNDIASYIQHHFDVEALSENNVDERTEWTQFVADLTNLAHGIFQWVRLVVPLIEQYISDGDSPYKIRQWLSQVPEELEQVYKHIVENIINPRNRVMSCRLFQWVFVARRPLTLIELRYALATYDIVVDTPQVRCNETRDFVKSDQAMQLQIKSWSGGLIEVVSSSDAGEEPVVQVIHQSVSDFLRNQGLQILTKFNEHRPGLLSTSTDHQEVSEIIAGCHADLYWLCLNYFLTEASATDAEAEVLKLTAQESFSSTFVTGSDGKRRVVGGGVTRLRAIRARFPLLEYVVIFTFFHAEKAGDHRNRGLEKEARLLDSMISLFVVVQGNIRFYLSSQPSVLWFHSDATTLHAAAGAGLQDLTVYILAQKVNIDDVDSYDETALHYAVSEDHLATAKLLFSAGANIDKDAHSGTPLMISAKKGHSILFSWLLDQGANLNAIVRESGTAIYEAADGGNAFIVKLCIQRGADVNVQGGYYGNPLQMASLRGHEKVVRLLLDAGAEVNTQGGHWGNALQAASLEGHKEVARLLLNAGAEVNTQGGHFSTALGAASQRGDVKMMRLLLDAGAEVNALGDYWESALQLASSGGREKAVRLLLEAGAKVDDVEGTRYTTGGNALQKASSQGHEKVVRLLLDAGADVNLQGRNDLMSLHMASYGGHQGVVRLLLDSGADVNARGGGNRTALQAASCWGYEEVIQILLDAGADAHVQGDAHGNALHEASSGGYEKVVRLLLDADVDVNCQGGIHGNALQAASLEGHEKVVRILLDAGADVNAQGGGNRNALEAASLEGYENIVRLLLEAGADARTQSGALQAASSEGHENIVQLLVDAGADVSVLTGSFERGSVMSQRRQLAALHEHRRKRS